MSSLDSSYDHRERLVRHYLGTAAKRRLNGVDLIHVAATRQDPVGGRLEAGNTVVEVTAAVMHCPTSPVPSRSKVERRHGYFPLFALLPTGSTMPPKTTNLDMRDRYFLSMGSTSVVVIKHCSYWPILSRT